MSSERPEGNLRGQKTPIPSRASTRVQRQLERENEAAELLARLGYDVEQNPPALPNGKQPDYLIEKQIFDHYAPLSSNPQQIRKGISRKIKEEQTDRIILNLNDSDVPLEALQQTLSNQPIINLKEIIVIRNDEAIAFFP